MSHVKFIYKNMLFINICVNKEVSGLVLKSLFKDRGLDSSIRSKCLFKTINLGGVYSFVCIRRRCLFTTRGRGLIYHLYLGRNIFKKLAGGGALVGFVKV